MLNEKLSFLYPQSLQFLHTYIPGKRKTSYLYETENFKTNC